MVHITNFLFFGHMYIIY